MHRYVVSADPCGRGEIAICIIRIQMLLVHVYLARRQYSTLESELPAGLCHEWFDHERLKASFGDPDAPVQCCLRDHQVHLSVSPSQSHTPLRIQSIQAVLAVEISALDTPRASALPEV